MVSNSFDCKAHACRAKNRERCNKNIQCDNIYSAKKRTKLTMLKMRLAGKQIFGLTLQGGWIGVS